MVQHPHSNPHGHSHGGNEEAEALFSALRGGADRGSRVTLLGLVANIGLTLTKAIAGYTLSSTALIADAGHGLSDLLGDFVTLGTWKLARRSPTKNYPCGFGRYESLGALVVAFFLLAGGFGLHSYHLLLGGEHDGQGHDGEEGDARAAVFALLSIVIKEHLYRVTIEVAREEQSNVLIASALHHRSDAQSSVVALLAIGASSLGFPVFDPLGGLAVAMMILYGGLSIGYDAFTDLMDQSTDPSLLSDLQALVQTLLSTSSTAAAQAAKAADNDIRLFKTGGRTVVDVLLQVPSNLLVGQTLQLAEEVKGSILREKSSVREVLVRFGTA